MSRELGWKGACGASVFVFVGGEGNITGQAGFVWDVVYHMEGDKNRDIGKAHWALMRAKTIYVKVCKFKPIGLIQKNS